MSGDDTGRGQRRQNSGGKNQPAGQNQPNRAGNPGQPGGNQPRQPSQQQGQPQQTPAGRQRQQSRSSKIDTSELPWISGALNGVAYFISTYITLGILFVADLFLSLDNFEPEDDFFIYGVGWKIYDSFLVTIPSQFDSFLSLVEGELVVPAIGYTVIAAVFLFLAGRSVARSQGTFETPNEQMALYGATVAVGYLLAAAAGAVVLKDGGNSPDLVESIVLMGVIFPVVFGGLGGYLAKR